MAYDGTLKFDTSLDASGFQKGASKLGDIVNGLGIFEIIKKGLSMIADSLDAAMGRLDTMDQFNRVMNTMTGSTEKTNKALKETTEVVTGTAYGLDTASKGVQAFVNSGMQVSKATDTMAAWADATSFYTKGTNAELETVSTALQKMQTKGTVTMEHLQMLLEAGIPAVQIYADAVGISTDEVTAAMSKGELKTDDFIRVMNEAFETGTSGFPSVAGAAKEAGASWSGSIDNMKAAITRGTASVLTSLDKMFNVKSNMVAFGKTIESVMKGVAEHLDVIAPIAIAATAALITLKVASSVSSAVKTLGTVVGAAVQQVLALASGSTAAASALVFQTAAEKALSGVVALGNVVKSVAHALMLVMTGATWAEAAATAGLSGAWTALNAIIFASPLGWILLAIVGVTAAIAGIVGAVKAANKEYYAEKDALKDLEKEHEGYADALNESKDAARNEAQEKVAQAHSNRDLLSSLTSLVDENGKVTGSTDEVRNKVKELNENIEGLGLAYDETNGQINMGNKELKAYGDALAAVTEYEAAQDEYNNILKERNSLQAKINALEAKKEIYNKMVEEGAISESQRNKLIKEADKLLEEYGDSLGDLEVDVKAYKKAADEAYNSEAEFAVKRQNIINTQSADIKKLAHQYDLSFDSIADAAAELDGGLEEWASNQSAKFTESGMDIEMLAQKWGMTVDQIKDYCDEWGMTYDEFNEEMKATHTDAGLSIEQLAIKWGTTTQAIKDQMAIQGISMQEWEDEQVRIFEEWQAAAVGGMEEVINGFKEIPEQADMSLDELNTLLETNNQRYAAWKQNLVSASATLGPEMMQVIESWGPGYNSLLEEYLADPNGEKGQKFYNQLKVAMETEVGAVTETNPAFEAAGEGNMNSVGTGMSKSTAPDTASQGIADQVVNNLTSADYSGITTGISNAIKSGMGGVSSAVSSLSSSVQSAVRIMSSNVTTITTTMMTQISARINSGRGMVVSAIGNIIAAIEEGMAKTSGIMSAADNVVSGIIAKLNGMVTQAPGVVDNMFRGMASAMDNWAPTLYGKADTIAQGIINRLNKAFQIHSPSKVMIGIFGNVMKGMIEGLGDNEQSLYAEIDGLTSGILSRFGSIDVGESLSNSLRQTVAAGRSGITSTTTTYAKNVSTVHSSTNNSRTIKQEIHFDQPIETPSQVTRAVRKAGEALANG